MCSFGPFGPYRETQRRNVSHGRCCMIYAKTKLPEYIAFSLLMVLNREEE